MASHIQSNKSCLSWFDCDDESKQPATISTAVQLPPAQQWTTQTWEEMKPTEDFLAAQLNRLTVQEREKALHDVHCVGDELKETPEMIERSLMEFDQLVRKMQNPIYEMAVNQNSRSYVEDPSFRLRFLRCNMHDVDRSVRQMMVFLKHKANSFGEDRVGREITISDLNEEDMMLLQRVYHIPDERDRNGRVVFYITSELFECVNIESFIHVVYYMCNNIMLPIPDVQTKGVAAVFYDVTKPGEKLAMPGYKFMTFASVVNSFPLRFSAMHICLKTNIGNLALYNSVLEAGINSLPEYARVRTRIFYGSDIEIHYYLQSHGIPTQTCPIDLDGNFLSDSLFTWFEKHKAAINAGKQHDTDPSGVYHQAITSERGGAVAVMSNQHWGGTSAKGAFHPIAQILLNQRKPSPQDVFLGRGWKTQNHTGNICFRQLVEGYRHAYDSTPRQHRREFAGNIARLLCERGVRFWKKNADGEWIEGTFEDAERKVGDLFRSLRRKAS